ncbi:MAG: YihY/virulence factor BrkB family protein [Ilumatobacteraceae bacterium]
MSGGDQRDGDEGRSETPSDPTPAPRRYTVVGTVRELIREVVDDDAVDAAASVAFWLLLSLPASLLAALASLSLLGDSVTEELRRVTLEFVDRVFTTEADELRAAIDGLFEQNNAGLFSVSVILAVVTVTRGFAGLIRALDVVYDIDESRNFLRLRVASLALGFGTLLTVALATLLWSWSRSAGVPLVVRILVALVILVMWATTLFHLGPNHHTPWRYDLPGAVLTATGWFVVSVGYGWYVQFGGSGNELVGIVGALLLGMTWFWLVCLVLLVGGELNQILAARAGVIGDSRRLRVHVTRARAALRRRSDAEDGPDA